MKKILMLGVLLIFVGTNIRAQSQEPVPEGMKSLPGTGFYVGGMATTNGVGAEIKYLFRKFTLKAGYETLALKTGFEFNEDDISYDATVNYKTGGLSLLADYNFIRHLYLSGGVVFSSFNPQVKGHSVSDVQYGDIVIPAEKVGDFSISFSPELKVSPYLGVGWRSFIGKNKRVVFSMGAGMYYMGSPQVDIEATGLLAPTADPIHGQKELLEKQLEQYKFYPVVKLNLAIKLF